MNTNNEIMTWDNNLMIEGVFQYLDKIKNERLKNGIYAKYDVFPCRCCEKEISSSSQTFITPDHFTYGEDCEGEEELEMYCCAECAQQKEWYEPETITFNPKDEDDEDEDEEEEYFCDTCECDLDPNDLIHGYHNASVYLCEECRIQEEEDDDAEAEAEEARNEAEVKKLEQKNV